MRQFDMNWIFQFRRQDGSISFGENHTEVFYVVPVRFCQSASQSVCLSASLSAWVSVGLLICVAVFCYVKMYTCELIELPSIMQMTFCIQVATLRPCMWNHFLAFEVWKKSLILEIRLILSATFFRISQTSFCQRLRPRYLRNKTISSIPREQFFLGWNVPCVLLCTTDNVLRKFHDDLLSS